MARDVFRKDDFQWTPRLPVFMPGGKLFGDKPGIGVEEWRGEVSPKCFALKICHMDVVPRCLQGMTLKGSARIGTSLKAFAIFRFGNDFVRSEDRATILIAITG